MLYCFLLSNDDSIRSGLPSVFRILLHQLAIEVQEKTQTIRNFSQLISSRIQTYYQHSTNSQKINNETSSMSQTEQLYIANTALLGDFCCEWMAILSVYSTSMKQRRVYQHNEEFRISRSLEKQQQT